MKPTDFYLIRHAKSAPSASLPEDAWPLSVDGHQQAGQLAEQLGNFGLQRIFSSPYPRAVDTVSPLATKLGLNVEIHPELRERRLADTLLDNWLHELEQSWKDFSYRLPGGESSADCQERIRSCILSLCRENPGRSIAAASHGNAIALLLHSIDPTFGFSGWKSMGNPQVFHLTWNGSALIWKR